MTEREVLYCIVQTLKSLWDNTPAKYPILSNKIQEAINVAEGTLEELD